VKSMVIRTNRIGHSVSWSRGYSFSYKHYGFSSHYRRASMRSASCLTGYASTPFVQMGGIGGIH
jgi:hypothetical protein